MWTFNNCKIEVVNGFTYVGLCFTNRLSMYQNTICMSCTDAILGDLGRYPMYICAVKRCLKYWLRLLKMPGHRYDNIGYNNCVSGIRVHWYQNGFGYIW